MDGQGTGYVARYTQAGRVRLVLRGGLPSMVRFSFFMVLDLGFMVVLEVKI